MWMKKFVRGFSLAFLLAAGAQGPANATSYAQGFDYCIENASLAGTYIMYTAILAANGASMSNVLSYADAARQYTGAAVGTAPDGSRAAQNALLMNQYFNSAYSYYSSGNVSYAGIYASFAAFYGYLTIYYAFNGLSSQL